MLTNFLREAECESAKKAQRQKAQSNTEVNSGERKWKNSEAYHDNQLTKKVDVNSSLQPSYGYSLLFTIRDVSPKFSNG